MNTFIYRCTGYRPILEAARSFAGCPKKDVAGEAFAPFPGFLKNRTTRGLQRFVGSGKELHTRHAALTALCAVSATWRSSLLQGFGASAPKLQSSLY